jgi:hypothetical protein
MAPKLAREAVLAKRRSASAGENPRRRGKGDEPDGPLPHVRAGRDRCADANSGGLEGKGRRVAVNAQMPRHKAQW